MLIDIGTTTCDVIPLTPAGPVAVGRTDPERLAAGELIYTGVERSPVCAIVSDLPWQELTCRVAQELFATTLDAYLTLGQIPEDATNCDTADGRPRTVAAARDRLARMICADRTMFSSDDAMSAALRIRDAQVNLLKAAFRQVAARQTSPPEVVVLSGCGEFLGRDVLEQVGTSARVVSLSDKVGESPSCCGPAYALSVLAAEMAASA